MLERMAIDIFEAAVILNGYLECADGQNRSDVVNKVSHELRAMARNKGLIISDAYRSAEGISGRIRTIGLAYLGKSGKIPIPKIFAEIVEIYKNNNSEYLKILSEANQMIEGHESLQNDFFKWLSSKVTPAQLSELYQAFEPIEQFCKKAHILKKPFFEITDMKVIRNVRFNIEANKTFKALYKKEYRKCIVAIRYYCSFLEGWLKSNNAEFSESLPEKKSKKFEVEEQNSNSYNEKNRKVNFNDIGDYYAYTKPVSLRYKEKEYIGIKTWAGVYQIIIRCLVEEYPSIFVSGTKLLSGPRIDLVSNDKAGILRKAADVGHNLVVEINISARDFVKRIASACDMASIPYSEIEIIYTSGKNDNALLSYDNTQIKQEEIDQIKYTLSVDTLCIERGSITDSFICFCEMMAKLFPLRFRTLIGRRIKDSNLIPMLGYEDELHSSKIGNLNAFVDSSLSEENIVLFIKWILEECGEKVNNISLTKKVIERKKEPIESENESEKYQPTKSETVNDKATNTDYELISCIEKAVLQHDLNGVSIDALREELLFSNSLIKQGINDSMHIIEIDGRLFHDDAFVDWDEGACSLESIIEKLLIRNDGYVSIKQLYSYACAEMSMFLNDNDIDDERSVYDIARHLFEKVKFNGKHFLFDGNMHISSFEANISNFVDIIKHFAKEHGGFFNYSELEDYLSSISVNKDNLRGKMQLTTKPIFFYYEEGIIVSAELMGIDSAWKKSVKDAVEMLFDEVGDHIILRDIPQEWFDRLPVLPDNKSWTPLLLQSVLRFYKNEIGARTIQALEGQSIDTLHAMMVSLESDISGFGDAVVVYLVENDIEQREYDAEQLRKVLLNSGMIHGGELYLNVAKALKNDPRFAWDVSENHVSIKV